MRVHVAIGVGVSAVLLLAGVLLFVQSKNPFYLVGTFQAAFLAWLAVLVYHLLTHGIPVRIVADERPPPPS